jgi:hypothetical protein
LAGATAGLFIAIIYLLLATPLYTARMVVGPAETATGLAGATGGLRAQLNMLVGDTGGTSVDPYQLFNELITSGSTARRMYDRGVLQFLNPGSWDAEQKKWIEPTGLKAMLRGTLHVVFGRPYWTAPSERTVEDMLKSDVPSHSDNGSLYFRVFEYKNSNPQKAVQFLQTLYDQTDAATRAAAMARSDTLAHYLLARVATVSEPEYRAAIYQALAQQEIMRIMGRSHAPFGAQMIDPPSASPTPTDPPLFRTLIIGIVLGAGAGVLIAYLLALFATRKRVADV